MRIVISIDEDDLGCMDDDRICALVKFLTNEDFSPVESSKEEERLSQLLDNFKKEFANNLQAVLKVEGERLCQKRL